MLGKVNSWPFILNLFSFLIFNNLLCVAQVNHPCVGVDGIIWW